MTRTALVTGVSGQDGAYLAQFLLTKGYRVVGALRRSSRNAVPRLIELKIANDVEFVDFDLAEITNIIRTLEKVQPDEIYNLTRLVNFVVETLEFCEIRAICVSVLSVGHRTTSGGRLMA